MRKNRVLLLAAILAFVLTTTKAGPQATGEAVNGLLMSIAHDDAATDPDKTTHFIVTFRNVGAEDMTITPGTIYGCGTHARKTNAIEINLTDSEGIPHRHLGFLGDGPPYQAGCAGSVRSFDVVLHPGTSFSLPLDLGKYLDLSDSKEYEEATFHSGTYSLWAELTGHLIQRSDGTSSPAGTWKGTVTSNILQVRFDKEFAAPMADYPK
jgi:hypothetical protein